MNSLLEISIMGSVMVVLVLLIRMVLQNRVRRSTILLFWMITLARFLIPVTISSPASIYNLPAFEPQGEVAIISDEVVSSPVTTEQIPAMDVVSDVPSTTADKASSNVPDLSLKQILFGGWVLGAAAIISVIAINHLRALGQYRFAIPVKELPVAIPSHVRVRSLGGLSAPLTYGSFHPVILLPPELLKQKDDRLEHILRHELAHVRHRDVAAKGLFLLAAAVHWYNPLVWVMVYVASRDMEMRCDEEVVRELGRAGKLSYARTLVSVEQGKLAEFLQAGFSFGSTAARLKAMLKAKPSVVVSTVAAVCLSVCLVVGFSTARAAEPETHEGFVDAPLQTEKTRPVVETTEATDPEANEWTGTGAEVPAMKEPVTAMQAEQPAETLTEPLTELPTEPPASSNNQSDDEDDRLYITLENISKEQQQPIQQQGQKNNSHDTTYYEDYSLLGSSSYSTVGMPGSSFGFPVISLYPNPRPGVTSNPTPGPQPAFPGAPTYGFP